MLRIIDASVALKWYLSPADEPHAELALGLLSAAIEGRVKLGASDLLLFELGNTLGRKRPENAAAVLNNLMKLNFSWLRPDAGAIRRAVELMQRYAVSFYDASYHALALEHQGQFVTADERYLAKAGKAGSIIHLKDWHL